MNVPETLNGSPVIRSAVHEDCVTVMVRGPSDYVVATWWPELGTSWSWGHYFAGPAYSLTEATKDFDRTCRRNSKR